MGQPVASGPGDTELRRQWIELWRPSDTEQSYEIGDVEGEIPRELHGTLYRIGPSQHVLPQAGYQALHLFDGDGLVHAFRFDDGRAWYRGRFVRNESFLLEEKRGRFCRSSAGVPAEEPADPGTRVQPNTNVVAHAQRLFALVENGVPFELDPDSLEPIGPFDLGGRLLGYATSAHPRFDPITGQMWIHGYQPLAPYVQLYAVEPDGSCSLAEPVDVPYATMMHDLAITERHVVFPLCPVTIDLQVLAQGRPFADALRWEPEKGLRFGVRGRAPGSPLRWFEAPSPGFLFHFGNAYEEDGKILVDACTYREGGALLDDLRSLRRGEFARGLVARPFLYELDLATGGCREQVFGDHHAEFPRLDERRVGRPNRWGYALTSRDQPVSAWDAPFARITRYDRRGGPSVHHRLPRGQWSGEPVFVPRDAGAEEGDGFLLSVVFDAATGRSHLLVLDTRGVDGEPRARLHLRHRIPAGFHGNFVLGSG